MQKVFKQKIIDVTGTGNSGYVRVDTCTNIQLLVISVGDAVDSQATLTFYGSPDGSNKYLLGIAPILTGTRDSDGVIVYDSTASQKISYSVTGVHKYVYVDVVADVVDINIEVWLIGQEE